MSVIARWCFRHRLLVITIWVTTLIGLGVLAESVKADYNNSFSLPGTGSTTAQQLLTRALPAQAGDPDTIVWQVSRGTVRDPAIRARMSALLDRIAGMRQVAAVASPYSAHASTQISRDGRIAYATVEFTKPDGSLNQADVHRVVDAAKAARERGLNIQLGGQAVARTDQAPLGVTTVIGVLGAAVVLFFAFGSLLAVLLPLVTATAGVLGGLMTISPLTHAINVVDFAPILGTLIGLGVGVDYALFIVTRHRRGLQAGRTPEQAAITAIETSGRAVLFAAATVCIALLGILILGVSFLSGLAVACALTVVFTVLAALTLLPALLGVLGTRVLSRGQRRILTAPTRDTNPGRGWTRWARFVEQRPAVLAAAATAVILLLAAPLLSLRLGSSDEGNNPKSSTTRQAYDLIADGFGAGFNGPLLLVAHTASPADAHAVETLTAKLRTIPDVADVTPLASGHDIRVIQVTPTISPEASATSALISALRRHVIPAAERGTTLHVYVGGVTATFADFTTVVNAKMPWFLAAILGSSVLLLVVAFRSFLVPVTAAVMNLLAAAATFGLLTAFFQWGWGTDTFGLGKAGPIESFLPVVILAILFGLSMDYQVFLVSRMHEVWRRTGDNAAAVRTGQVDTGRVVTAAAAIMICVFLTFALLGQRDVAEFGIGLAAAVALDAFVLRTVLVPAVMHLFGTANWWLPRRLDQRLPHLAFEPADHPVMAAPVPVATERIKVAG